MDLINSAFRTLSRFGGKGSRLIPAGQAAAVYPVAGALLGLIPAAAALLLCIGANPRVAMVVGALLCPFIGWWITGFRTFNGYLAAVEKVISRVPCPMKTEIGPYYWAFSLFNLALLLRIACTLLVLWSCARQSPWAYLSCLWLALPAVFTATFHAERMMAPFKQVGFDDSRRWAGISATGTTLVLGGLAGGIFGAVVTGLLALLLMPHLRRFLRSLELPPTEAFSACSEMLELFVLLAGAVTLLR